MSNNLVNRNDINRALDTLKSGGVILYPTDTVWGLGCDATNPQAIEKILSIKKRDNSKSMIILLHSENQLSSYVDQIPEVAYELIEVTDRPLTVIYSKGKNLPPIALAKDGSIGIRIVDHPFCTQLLQRFRKPIISTSANISANPFASNFEEIDNKIKEAVDYIVEYDQDNQRRGIPSLIVKLDEAARFEFVRK